MLPTCGNIQTSRLSGNAEVSRSSVEGPSPREILNVTNVCERLRCNPPSSSVLNIPVGDNVQGDVAPTKKWLTTYGEDNIPPKWTKEDVELLPIDVKKLIQLEEEHLDTHVPVYNARPGYLTSYQMLSEELLREANQGCFDDSPLSKINWVRSPLQDPPMKGQRHGCVDDIINTYQLREGGSLAADNGPAGSWQLLSCNPSFFQNSNVSSEESTADYLFSEMAVIPPDGPGLIGDIRKNLGLPKNSKLDQEISNRLIDLHKMECPEGGKNAVLLQILIPNNLVNRVAYIAKERGYQDVKNENCYETLKKLQKNGAKVPNEETLQVRLSTALMLDPEIGPAIKVIEHSAMTDLAKSNLRSGVNAIAREILNEVG